MTLRAGASLPESVSNSTAIVEHRGVAATRGDDRQQFLDGRRQNRGDARVGIDGAYIQFIFPRRVLISPLWPNVAVRVSQLPAWKSMVEKRWWTRQQAAGQLGIEQLFCKKSVICGASSNPL